MKAFGEAGAGVFTTPTTVEDDVRRKVRGGGDRPHGGCARALLRHLGRAPYPLPGGPRGPSPNRPATTYSCEARGEPGPAKAPTHPDRYRPESYPDTTASPEVPCPVSARSPSPSRSPSRPARPRPTRSPISSTPRAAPTRSGDLRGAVDTLNFAVAAIQEQITQGLLKLLQEPIAGWQADPAESESGGLATMITGTNLSRRYFRDDGGGHPATHGQLAHVADAHHVPVEPVHDAGRSHHQAL